MMEYHDVHTSALVILLNELKSKFDSQMLRGDSFDDVKKIYVQIKELESQLSVINWQNPGKDFDAATGNLDKRFMSNGDVVDSRTQNA